MRSPEHLGRFDIWKFFTRFCGRYIRIGWMGQNKNTGLIFADPKQTLSSLGRARWNARSPKTNCKGNSNAPDNHLSSRSGGRERGSSSLPHKTMLGLNPMGVVNAAHSYASTILEGGKIPEIAPLVPFPFEHFFMELAKARDEESSIRANLELPIVLPVQTNKQQPSWQPRSFSLSKSENIDTDLYDLLPLPSFRERSGPLSCANSRHNGINHLFPRKRQRVGGFRHLAGSTAEKMKHNNEAVKRATQKELLERKNASSMKLQTQMDGREKQQTKLQANEYDQLHSMDSGSIISIRSEDEQQWFKVLTCRPGHPGIEKNIRSAGFFNRVSGGTFNVANGISRETVREVMKKTRMATAKVLPKKETLETPPFVMTSTEVSKGSKINNVQNSSNISNEYKADDEKTCEVIDGVVDSNVHHDGHAGDGTKTNSETAVVATPKPDTEPASTVTNPAPVVPSVINHVHVEAPTSAQTTTIPPEIFCLLRELTKHQHTLAEAAKRQMEMMEQSSAPANKAELLCDVEELSPHPPPSVPIPPSPAAPIVVMQEPCPPSSHPVTSTSHKEDSSYNRRLNTALVSAIVAVSNRLDNMDDKVTERMVETERIAQEAMKRSKDSSNKFNKLTLESRFEKVGTVSSISSF